VETEEESIIVEKNLFHPERRKWLMEDKAINQGEKINNQIKKKLLENIVLYGTLQSDDYDYAIIRTKKTRRKNHQNNLFMEGDYVDGYILAEINKKSIVIKDNERDKHYEIFLNEGKKDRKPVKTTITRKRRSPSSRKISMQKSRKPKKALTANVLKKRVNRSLNILARKKNKLVIKQAEKDFKKLDRLMPYMSDADIREVIKLKKRYERLID
jgi:hypothetical protein